MSAIDIAVFLVRSPITRILPPRYLFSFIANKIFAEAFEGLARWVFYSNGLLCASMMVSLVHRRNGSLISREWGGWLGDMNYPIYLLHYPLGFLFRYVFQQSSSGIQKLRDQPFSSVFALFSSQTIQINRRVLSDPIWVPRWARRMLCRIPALTYLYPGRVSLGFPRFRPPSMKQALYQASTEGLVAGGASG